MKTILQAKRQMLRRLFTKRVLNRKWRRWRPLKKKKRCVIQARPRKSEKVSAKAKPRIQRNIWFVTD